jgi:polysaccharide export outer membrane protein
MSARRNNPIRTASFSPSKPDRSPRRLAASLALLVTGLLALAGCKTPPPAFQMADEKAATNVVHTESIVLREGDMLRITFPNNPAMGPSQQPIRRDGIINLALVGDVKAAGKTPDQLKADLLKLYSDKINARDITVELLSSAFPVFVSGAVLRPEKVMSDHPITALEAIMEAGGPDFSRANLKAVKVLRQESGGLKSYRLNLKAVLDGTSGEQFYMKPSDIIVVPEKFSWF